MSETKEHPFLPYRPPRPSLEETLRCGREFHERMDRRRSVRFFSPDPVPRECIELAVRTAGTAPSGAHRQPWRFVAVSNPDVKRAIREAAERTGGRNSSKPRRGSWSAFASSME
jgi:iodotyrosine deiodinase